MTFSIVATDGVAMGVAVASRFLAVGSVVPGARAGIGAVATQSLAKASYVPDLLAALADGESASSALARLTAADAGREDRQVGVVGVADQATFTGQRCVAWAGGLARREGATAYAIQGNIVTGPEVIEAMEHAWLASAGLSLPQRLVAALSAGDTAGGDRRGRQSAAVYAQRPGAGYDAAGVLVDLRVDDHADPVRELRRLLALSDLYFGEPEDVQPLTGDLAEEVRRRLDAVGVRGGLLASDLAAWASEANLETRLSGAGIDIRVLAELRAASHD